MRGDPPTPARGGYGGGFCRFAVPTALQTAQPPFHLTPAAVLARWPVDQPLAVLWSGRPGRRQVTFARPEAGPDTRPGGWIFPSSLSELQQAWAQAQAERALLAGFLSYELGRRIEPAAAGGAGGADRGSGLGAGWPLIAFVRCRQWGTLREDGRWEGPFDLAGLPLGLAADPGVPGGPPADFTLGSLRSSAGRERYQRDVARIIERIRAGDVYQVNLAHQLAGAFRGSARALFARLAAAADPWHGAYLEMPAGAEGAEAPARAICSVSPELFLEYEPSSLRVMTRPMKGTRPAGGDPAELASAPKDTAELNMIIDLMRNDLGRSCAFGSVRVEAPRTIERHGSGGGGGGVLQATGEVSGVLRPEVSFLEALGQAFPAGSVTGAPKIQAMKMIERLEPPRGPYCGSVCELRPDGSATCSVAIRTALIRETGGPPGGPPLRGGRGSVRRPGWFDNAELSWSVGAGIVADSDPAAEWQETLDKAQILLAAAETRIDD